MRDYYTLGPTPADEPCACIGEENYRERALEECKRYIELLRATFGSEPYGARLSVKWFPHDFGDYVEVVCHFDTDISESADYAMRCEDNAPATWKGGEEHDMTDSVCCDNCGKTWPEDALDPVHDFWGRVDPGGVLPIGQCPDAECGALCCPPYGYVYGLEQHLASLRDVLTRLLEWAQAMGGWEAPVWKEAQALLGQPAADEPCAEEETFEMDEQVVSTPQTIDPNPLTTLRTPRDHSETVCCKFCQRQVPAHMAHWHDDGYVGDACCWDERLRASE